MSRHGVIVAGRFEIEVLDLLNVKNEPSTLSRNAGHLSPSDKVSHPRRTETWTGSLRMFGNSQLENKLFTVMEIWGWVWFEDRKFRSETPSPCWRFGVFYWFSSLKNMPAEGCVNVPNLLDLTYQLIYTIIYQSKMLKHLITFQHVSIITPIIFRELVDSLLKSLNLKFLKMLNSGTYELLEDDRSNDWNMLERY
jgi:hypothetical protein